MNILYLIPIGLIGAAVYAVIQDNKRLRKQNEDANKLGFISGFNRAQDQTNAHYQKQLLFVFGALRDALADPNVPREEILLAIDKWLDECQGNIAIVETNKIIHK